MLNVRKIVENYEKKARTFAEIVPFMILVNPHMVLNKDGSLTVCFKYEGVDQEGLEAIEVDRYAALMEHALRNFDERITLWWTVDRRRTDEYPDGTFSNQISSMINQEWRKQFSNGSQYVNSYYLSLVFTPPSGAEGFMDKVAYFSKEVGHGIIKSFSEAAKSQLLKRSAFAYSAMQIDGFIKTFSDIVQSFSETVDEVDLQLLQNDDLLSFLHDRCSPASAGNKVQMPRMPAYLDSWMPDNTMIVESDTLRFKGDETKHLATVSVKDWPDLTYPGIFDSLMAIQGEITLSQCFRFVDPDKAKKYIHDVERHNRNLQKSLGAYIKEAITKEESRANNEGRIVLAQDASDALLEMTTENRVYGYYNMTVVAYGKDKKETEDVIKMVTKMLRRGGFLVVRETLHLLSSWAATIPGQWAELVRMFFMNTGNIADMSPIRTLHCGIKRNKHLSEQSGKDQPALTVLATEYSTPYYFNFHQADLAHTIVVGPSGMGKSVFDNFLISQFRKYEPCNVFIFDKDYSCRISTLLQGGEHVDLLGERGGAIKLNPMLLLENRDNWMWLAKWVEILLTARGHEMKAEDDKSLFEAMENVAAQPRSSWKLQSLYPYLNKVLGEQLQQWIGDGPMAKFFDNSEDSFDLGEFSCIEMGGLFHNPRLATAFMEYAFYRLQQKLDGRVTVIYVEEAWFMLAEPAFASRINDWLRTLRKKNAFVVMATQSLDEISSSTIFSTIIDNIPNRIYLPNPNAYAHKELYMRKFGLNETQVQRIRNAMPKLNYYIVTPLLSRMVDAKFPPKVLACLRSDDKAQKVFDDYYRNQRPGWEMSYIEEVTNA